MTWIEVVATIAGLLCVYWTVKENIWCWPVGLVQVVLYAYIFYNAKLYSDAILQVIYIFLQFYGWYAWATKRAKPELFVTKLSNVGLFTSLGITVVGTAIWGYIMATYTDAAFPYTDSAIVVMSLVATYLLAKKKLQAWWYWIVVDITALYVYFAKGLYITEVLYALFLILAISGAIRWSKGFKKVKIATV